MEKTPPGFTLNVHANTAHELREVLGQAHDKITDLYDIANRIIHKADKEAAFARYLRGPFWWL